MKKLLIIISLALTSCVESNNPSYPVKQITDSTIIDSIKTPRIIHVNFTDGVMNVVIIDECEYLYGPWGNGNVLTHKGNCKNPIHK